MWVCGRICFTASSVCLPFSWPNYSPFPISDLRTATMAPSCSLVSLTLTESSVETPLAFREGNVLFLEVIWVTVLWVWQEPWTSSRQQRQGRGVLKTLMGADASVACVQTLGKEGDLGLLTYFKFCKSKWHLPNRFLTLQLLICTSTQGGPASLVWILLEAPAINQSDTSLCFDWWRKDPQRIMHCFILH